MNRYSRFVWNDRRIKLEEKNENFTDWQLAFASPSPQFPSFEQFIKPDQSGKGNEQLYPAHPIQLYNIIKQEKRDLPRRKISCKIHSTSLSLSLHS